MGMTPSGFHQSLTKACQAKDSYLCVGLDPRLQYLPSPWNDESQNLESQAQSYRAFCCEVVDVIAEHVPIVKPQSAFFESLGAKGVAALEDVCIYARSKGLLVLGDVKRGDIGTTAEAYAKAAFRKVDGNPLFDAVTVNPYLGSDGVLPFVREAAANNGGVFVLCKTSNPSSKELQDRVFDDQRSLNETVAGLITEWGQESLGLVGAVVGGTHPDDLASLRSKLPHGWILIPGVGAQGATYDDASQGFDPEHQLALVSASRSITFPWLKTHDQAPSNWQELILQATLEANSQLRQALNHD